MNILLTGATGFLGSHLTKALLENNYNVCFLKRSFDETSKLDSIMSKLKFYDIDLVALDEPFKDQKIDLVIHTATCYGRENEPPSIMMDANYMFPLKLLELAICNGCKSFINTDSFFTKFADYEYLSTYIQSKIIFREFAKHYASKQNFSFLNLKLEHIYGTADHDSKFTMSIIKQCMDNIPELKLTEGIQKRDFIYVEDVVNAYLCIIQNLDKIAPLTEFEVGTGITSSIRTYVETAHRLANSDTKLLFGAIPQRGNEIPESKANNDKLVSLGWSPKFSLENGIQKIIDSIKVH